MNTIYHQLLICKFLTQGILIMLHLALNTSLTISYEALNLYSIFFVTLMSIPYQQITVMRRIMMFQSTVDCIYDSGPRL